MTWLSLIPPITVVLTALLTTRINPALIAGILSACFIGAQFDIVAALGLLKKYACISLTTPDHLMLAGFLCSIGVLISLFNHTGAAQAFAQKVHKRIGSAIGAQRATMILSCALSLDDYLSILTTGYTMRPVTQTFNIHPLKLAFLVHSFAGPVVILAPFSSWVGTITGSIATPQLTTRPLFVYLSAMPYLFYSFFVLVSAWLIVSRRISFGPMRAHEEAARTAPTQEYQQAPHNAQAGHFLMPLIVMVFAIVTGLAYTGGYRFFDSPLQLLAALQQGAHVMTVMCCAAILAVCTALLLSARGSTLSLKRVPALIYAGWELMRPAIIMVLLALTLSLLLQEVVHTGQYLADIMRDALPIALLPAASFIISLLITMATGSSWGTFALMLPIATDMTLRLLQIPLPTSVEAVPLLLPVVAAVLCGAVCGDHLSPFSETTIMTATSTGTRPFEHAYTQFFYMVPAVLGSITAFIAAGLLAGAGVLFGILLPFTLGLGICLGLLFGANGAQKSRENLKTTT